MMQPHFLKEICGQHENEFRSVERTAPWTGAEPSLGAGRSRARFFCIAGDALSRVVPNSDSRVILEFATNNLPTRIFSITENRRDVQFRVSLRKTNGKD